MNNIDIIAQAACDAAEESNRLFAEKIRRQMSGTMTAQEVLSHFHANASVCIRVRHIVGQQLGFMVEVTDSTELNYIRSRLVQAMKNGDDIVAEVDGDGMLIIG